VALPKAFPLEAPILPESRQIGRTPAIDALERQIVEMGHHTLLFAPRHVGKTSMAWAVLDRIRDADWGSALEVNVSHGPVRSSAALAARVADQARAAKIRVDPVTQTVRRVFKKVARVIGTPAIGAAAKHLGLDEGVDATTVAAAVDQALAATDNDAEMNLREVLGAIQAAAIAADKPAVIFLDEVQRLCTDWSDGNDSLYSQEPIAEVMEHPEGRVVFLLAGSEVSAIEQLLADGQPLHRDGMTFEVQAIRTEDWRHGLSNRFAEVNLEIEGARINQILEASEGHPQRTMRVCAHVHQLADNGTFEISEVLVDEAISKAKTHPSWTA